MNTASIIYYKALKYSQYGTCLLKQAGLSARAEHRPLLVIMMLTSMEWSYVSELRPPKGLLFIPRVI
jgi:hypothetical protein